MNPVQRVTRLEGDNVNMAESLQLLPRLAGRQAQLLEVEVLGGAQHFQLARNVERSPPVHLRYQRMARIAFAKHLRRRLVQIPLIDLFHGQNRQDFVLQVA